MIIDFNENWIFFDKSKKPISICLPHDAMISEPRDATCINSKQSGYFPGGKYTYVKNFIIPDTYISKVVELLFEGVYQNCKIYVNEKFAVAHKYGLRGFSLSELCRGNSNPEV